jgi:8-oxo-dGTP pyrophosphatase MutT (NUDIX family)
VATPPPDTTAALCPDAEARAICVLMPLPPVQRLSAAIVGRHGIFDIVRHEVEGTEGPRVYITLAMLDWVSIAAVTSDNQFVLVRQYRHGISDVTLETAGGFVDEGETPQLAARRELREESGYSSREVQSLGSIHPNTAMQNNRCHIFLARGVECSGLPAPDEDEYIEPVLLEAAAVRRAIDEGVITNALSILTLERALSRLGLRSF